MTRLLGIACCAALLLRADVSARAADPRDSMPTSVDWLAAHIDDPDLVLIQVGMGDRQEYAAGHIPGAHYVPIEQLAAPHEEGAPGLLLELPSEPALRDVLQRLGITATSRIVVYFSQNQVADATRAVLTLDHAGFGARTSMLQGGQPAWRRAGHTLTRTVPVERPSRLKPLALKQVTVDADYVQAIRKMTGVVLVDARDQASYDGIDPSRSAGHIPGAVSLYVGTLFNDAHELRPAADLKRLFANAGVKPGDTIVAYCWLGSFATGVVFAGRTLGHDVLLYDGSYDDWMQRRLPIEKGKGH